MSRCIAFLGLIVACAAIMSSCALNTAKGLLTVEITDWSGWEEGYESITEQNTFEPEEGATLFERTGIYLKIEKVSAGVVTLKSDGGLCITSENGGIDLLSKGIRKYKLGKGEEVTFATQTMDAGWYIRLKYE